LISPRQTGEGRFFCPPRFLLMASLEISRAKALARFSDSRHAQETARDENRILTGQTKVTSFFLGS
jgi:hypothetical protein